MNNNIYSSTIKIIDGTEHFFVTFIDINCHTQTIEVSEYIYNEFQQFKKIEKRQQHHFERHIEHSVQSDENLHRRSTIEPDLTEDIVIERICHDAVNNAVTALSAVQKRRIVLYYEYGFSYEKIAKIEGCSKVSIKRSLDRAKEQIFVTLKKYYEEI